MSNNTLPMKAIVPSKYQTDFYEAVMNGNWNIGLEAVAGSGKSTSIEAAVRRVRPGHRIVILAFNKRIADAMVKRVPANVDVMTFHKLGFAMLRNNLPFKIEEVNAKHVSTLIREHIISPELKEKAWGTMKELTGLAKNYVLREEKEILQLMEMHDVFVHKDLAHSRGRTRIAQAVIKLLDASLLLEDHKIDFDDMLYIPVVKNFPAPAYDVVFVDESQDLNEVQTILLQRILRNTGRIIFVGDKRQAIYAFRGANSESMDKMYRIFKARPMPLSICYRCAKSIVAEAKKDCPEIEADPNAPEGEVRRGIDEPQMLREIKPGDWVLCRVTKFLVKTYFKLIRKKMRATILGRDIGEGLVKFIQQFEAVNIRDLEDKMEKFYAEEAKALLAKHKENAHQTLLDKVDTVSELIAACSSLHDLIEVTNNMFSDQVEGVVLSTIHKSKGFEADNVWIIHPELLPHPRATQAWAIEQENNLKYVAITRARLKLTFVKPPPEDDEDESRGSRGRTSGVPINWIDSLAKSGPRSEHGGGSYGDGGQDDDGS